MYTSLREQDNVMKCILASKAHVVSLPKDKLTLAKEYVRDHPCSPGVLSRWMESRKDKGYGFF